MNKSQHIHNQSSSTKPTETSTDTSTSGFSPATSASHVSSQVDTLCTDQSYAQAILNRIKDEKIKPRSKWYFILKNELFWGIGILTVVVGACSVSAALFNLSHAEFNMYHVTHDSLISFVYDMMPLVWILGFILFVGLGYVQIRHTKKGYKYPLHVLTGAILILSIALGIIFHILDVGRRTEGVVGRYIPFHQSVESIKQRQWVNVQKGMIAGEVIYINTQPNIRPDIDGAAFTLSAFRVKDFQGDTWNIDGSYLNEQDIALVATGTRVRVVALPIMSATSTLTGCIVIPWEDMSMQKKMRPPMVQEARQLVSIERGQSGERKNRVARNNICKEILPYQLLQKIRAEI